MSVVPKKTPVGGREPNGNQSHASTPSRSSNGPSATSNHSNGGGGITPRTRPIRTGTPVSARAAAPRRGREANLCNGSNTTQEDEDEDARTETVSILDDLKERLSQAEGQREHCKRQVEVLESKLDEAHREHLRLEEKVHEAEEQIEGLLHEKREKARQMREMESIYEAERGAMAKEREQMSNREEEMQRVIQRLKDSLSQRNDEESWTSRQSANSSTSIDSSSFAPPSTVNRSDSRNSSKLLLQKDKLIEALRLELAEAQMKLAESENVDDGRLHDIELQLIEARKANAHLIQDNESYQLLLEEKTLNGDLRKEGFRGISSCASENEDALAALEGRAGTSLADELSEAVEDKVPGELYRKMKAELRAYKDENKALLTYIESIIDRIIENKGFEHILDQSGQPKRPERPDVNKELPAPPPNEEASPAPSFLQRARTTLTRGPAPAKARPRPMSSIPTTMLNPAHNNPDTAPRIPIGLTRSTSYHQRRVRPASEQFTGSAASVVNNMYKGVVDRPLSPQLQSGQGSYGGDTRVTSGPMSNMSLSTSGNFPGMKSDGSSISSESLGEVTTPPNQSPPRHPPSHSSEKTTTIAGNKPRPLRLVEENPDMAAPLPLSKRNSWFGWIGGGGGLRKDDVQSPNGTSTIPE